jgi:nucleoid DNA-binding protein
MEGIMGTVQYRVERNPLTKPASYKLRFLPKQTAGYDELAAALAKDSGLSVEQAKAFIQLTVKNIKQMLCNGIQVTLEDAFTFALSFHIRLNSPGESLPSLEEFMRISVSATRPFTQDVQQDVTLELVPTEEKAPTILSAADTGLGLNDVLNPAGVLHIAGSNMLFDKNKPDCGCVIAGTRSGSEKQTQFGSISNTEVLVVPHIPPQDDPWNNEYTLAISTKYTEHGSVRTGIYGRRLRTPLTVDLAHAGESGVGILTGDAASPYVWITARAGSGAAQLRIQAQIDPLTDTLSLRLLDMQDRGAVGAPINIIDNGSYVLPGFSGSVVTNITVVVSYLDELTALVRNNYDGNLVDVLDVVG